MDKLNRIYNIGIIISVLLILCAIVNLIFVIVPISSECCYALIIGCTIGVISVIVDKINYNKTNKEV